MDYQTDMSYDLHGCGKELESPPCSPSYIVAGMSGAEMIIEDGEEDELEGNGMKLQQQQPDRRRNLTSSTEMTNSPTFIQL
ncbi:hypothetical protein SDJN03_00704, partial [Cucurbita argyrosperma subsp. sororia]